MPDIKQRIVLDGEKQYSQAIKNAQRNLKTLRSELKAETAELGTNATAQQKNEVKAKSLQKQISEQEKVVKTCRDALDEVREKYGDNEEAISKWEVKLNQARESLANLKNQLDTTSTSIKGVESNAESFKAVEEGAKSSAVETVALAESFSKISDAAGGMASKLESAFGAVVGTIKQTIGAVWSDLMDIAGKADNWLDLASYLGSSAEEVQKWDSAMKGVGGDLSSVINMISKLKYSASGKKMTEWFGISGANYTDDLEYAQVVLQKMADTKDEMVANGTWAKAMEEIFGTKKVQEVDGILSDWTDILTGLETFDVSKGGVGMSEDEIQTMGELFNSVGLLQEKWNAFKRSAETKIFGKLALDITSNAHGAMDALIEFMDADTQEERDAAIDKFQENITEAFTKIGEAIAAAAEALDAAGKELQGSENSYVRLLGDILTGLSDAMKWLTDEGSLEKIKYFFETFFGLWVSAKAISTIGNIAQLVTNLTNLRNTGWFGGGGGGNLLTGGGGGGALVGGGGAAAAGGGAGGGGILASVGTFLTSSVAKAAGAVGIGLGVLFENALKEQGNDNLVVDENGTLRIGQTGEEYHENDRGPIILAETRGRGSSIGSGIALPTVRTPQGTQTGFDITEEQRTAAEAFFDAWKALERDPNSEAAGNAFDETADQFEAAFAGQEKLYNMLMDNMDVLKEKGGDNWTDMEDLPSSWFRTPWEGQENQITSSDLSGFRSLPDSLYNAVLRGASSGVSGIQVTIDGYTAGRIIAPYVSQEIARGLN